LADTVAVLLELGKSFEVVEQPFYDGLENLRVNVGEVVPPLLEAGKFRPQGGHGRQFAVFVLVLVETVERVVVQLPTNVSVAVQLLTVGVRRLETVLVGVVHPLLSFLNEFVQLFSDERREIEVLVLNPLVLVFPNGDCLPFHRNARYAHYTYNSYGRHGSGGPATRTVYQRR